MTGSEKNLSRPHAIRPHPPAQPMLPMTSVDVSRLLRQVSEQHFPELSQVPVVYFVQSGPLASIVHDPVQDADLQAVMYLHSVLNHHDVPKYVFTFILKHELLHLTIPPREVDGRMSDHPPEFYAQEQRIAPERAEAWDWLMEVLFDRLKIDKQHECIEVKAPRRLRRPKAW